MNSFEIKDEFYLNGKPFKIVSGSIHYFRVVPEYWRDRLEKIKAMGCNTVETYIAWNVHEPKKGQFNFSGMADITRFVRTAEELGLWVILRPSPYICAEWEFGGMPAWLIADPDVKVRSTEGSFLRHVEEYYRELFKVLRPLQITNGGPVLMYQIENEYGAYGHDKQYMERLRDIMTENGADIPFITSDGPWDDYLACGSVKGILPTANFGSSAEEQLPILESFQKKHFGESAGRHPLMCMEFWVGWFDAWGDEKHNTGDTEKHAKDLDTILGRGSVNIYMAHGGTNFGFMNGANYYEKLTPDVTSYDYDSLLTEDGVITKKYEAFKKVIDKHLPGSSKDYAPSTHIERKNLGKVGLTAKTSLFASLDEISTPVETCNTKSMEELGQSYGYMLYHADLKYEKDIRKFGLYGANDRAKVYFDGEHKATLYDRELLSEIVLDHKKDVLWNGEKLDILVENMGRVNYGIRMSRQYKGIKDGVVLNGHVHTGWKQYPLPLDNVDRLSFTAPYVQGQPAFYKFELDMPAEYPYCTGADGVRREVWNDTFLDLTGFGKGCVFLNGFNLGRFWEIGPQKRLYIPGPLLKAGHNEIVVFETEGKAADHITLCDEPKLE